MNEQEILRLRSEVAAAETEEASARSAAVAVETRMREAGVDLTAADNFAQLDEAYKPADAARDRVAEIRARYTRALEIAGRADSERKEVRTRDAADAPKSPIMRLIESEAYARLRESGVLQKQSSRVQMDDQEILTREETLASHMRLRTTFDNSANIGSGLLTPDYTGKLVDVLVRKIRLLDLITVGTTDTDTVDYIVEQARTDAADATAYGTAVPESAYGFAHATTAVRRIGHFVPATKGILADAGQTSTLLSSRLITGLELKVENEVFSGVGTGEHVQGFAASGVVTNVKDVTSDAAGSRLDALHKAITLIRTANSMQVEANVFMIAPADYETIALQKASTGEYLFNIKEPASVWGLTPVVTPLVSAGTVWVGDFAEACTMWLRQGVSVSASDQHSDYFLRGLVALMAETRLAFKTTRATAICKVTSF